MAQIATGNRDEAMDIVQDAMYKLVKHYKSRDCGQWPLLFHRILQNRIRDWYRRNKVRKIIMVFSRIEGEHRNNEEKNDVMNQISTNSGEQPEQKLAHHNAMKELQSALHQLPGRQQQAFMLRVWEGLDVAQTADAMSCSQGSVKTHYSRAIHSLRISLGDHWDDK